MGLFLFLFCFSPIQTLYRVAFFSAFIFYSPIVYSKRVRPHLTGTIPLLVLLREQCTAQSEVSASTPAKIRQSNSLREPSHSTRPIHIFHGAYIIHFFIRKALSLLCACFHLAFCESCHRCRQLLIKFRRWNARLETAVNHATPCWRCPFWLDSPHCTLHIWLYS